MQGVVLRFVLGLQPANLLEPGAARAGECTRRRRSAWLGFVVHQDYGWLGVLPYRGSSDWITQLFDVWFRNELRSVPHVDTKQVHHRVTWLVRSAQ